MPSSHDEPPRSASRAPLREAKQALRSRVLAARDALSETYRVEASRAIVARIVATDAWRTSAAILATLPFRSEWDTRALVAAALGGGKTVAMPRVAREIRMLELREVRDVARDVVAGALGIPEPRADLPLVPHAAIGLVVMPGVAFDASGARLGYGGGYYDRLLPLLGSAALVAGAFEVQLVDAVPHGPHDQRVHAIATELRMVVAQAQAA